MAVLIFYKNNLLILYMGIMVYCALVYSVKRTQTLIFFCSIMIVPLIPVSPVRACTIWAATGEQVESKGSLIAKNRDNLSHLYTVLKTVSPEKGIPFYGLFDIEADGYVTAGINEQGLVVVNSAANSVPRNKRLVATEDLTLKLLTSFGSVNAILSEKGLFQKSHPALYIIGDVSRIASIEVAPGGKISVTVQEKGALILTNHYTNPELAEANEQSSTGSLMRLRRIQYLTARQTSPFTLDDFITFSNDRNDGSEGALWQAPGASGTIRTLASWIVYMPPSGPPVLYVKLANPGEPERTYTVTLDSAFWKQKKSAEP
jgi:hypothetical protein